MTRLLKRLRRRRKRMTPLWRLVWAVRASLGNGRAMRWVSWSRCHVGMGIERVLPVLRSKRLSDGKPCVNRRVG
jgi:hypothetical protein